MYRYTYACTIIYVYVYLCSYLYFMYIYICICLYYLYMCKRASTEIRKLFTHSNRIWAMIRRIARVEVSLSSTPGAKKPNHASTLPAAQGWHDGHQ